MSSSSNLKKVDRYTGIDVNGVPHNLEVHRSGLTPDTWICGYCGKPLKGVDHVVGLQHGYRYCRPCFDKGKQLKDMPDYSKMVKPKSV